MFFFRFFPFPSLPFSLTRKLADLISTKLHCVSYLYTVAPTARIRNCTLPSPSHSFSPLPRSRNQCGRYIAPACTHMGTVITVYRATTFNSFRLVYAGKNLPIFFSFSNAAFRAYARITRQRARMVAGETERGLAAHATCTRLY